MALISTHIAGCVQIHAAVLDKYITDRPRSLLIALLSQRSEFRARFLPSRTRKTTLRTDPVTALEVVENLLSRPGIALQPLLSFHFARLS